MNAKTLAILKRCQPPRSVEVEHRGRPVSASITAIADDCRALYEVRFSAGGERLCGYYTRFTTGQVTADREAAPCNRRSWPKLLHAWKPMPWRVVT